MNKNDKKEASALLSQLEDIQPKLDSLATAEQEKFDNMTEGLQAGERGQTIEQAANALREAADAVQQAMDALGNIEL